MSALAEIETAADSLPSEQRKNCSACSPCACATSALPTPRNYFEEEIASMLTEDQPATGKASEWLRTAKDSVLAAADESADNARMAYYTAKYGVKQRKRYARFFGHKHPAGCADEPPRPCC